MTEFLSSWTVTWSFSDPMFNLFVWAQWHFLSVNMRGKDKHVEFQIEKGWIKDHKYVDAALSWRSGWANNKS